MDKVKREGLLEIASGYIKVSHLTKDDEEYPGFCLMKSIACSLLVIADRAPSVKKPKRQASAKPKLVKRQRR